MGSINIRMEDLDGGIFLNGLRFCAQASHNYHKRLAFSKLARAVEKAVRPLQDDRVDMIRAFKTGESKGKPEVDPAAMDEIKAAEWKTKDEAWKNHEVTLESDLVSDGKIKFELSQSEADKFPSVCLEFMEPYIDLTINDKKEIDVLRQQVAQLQAAVAAGKSPE